MLNVAIVGHVDHGKSTLIGRLLYDTNSLPKGKIEEIERVCKGLGRELEFAYICDALEEERMNQMTIETMQIFFRTKKREYAIIDAPGHKEFLKNMVTGVSQANSVILVVDAKEGVKEQTKRHAYLVKLLGIENVIVAINKLDLIDYKYKVFRKIRNDIVNYLKKINLKYSFVVPISAYFGDNVVKKSKKIKWYKGLTIVEVLDNLKEKKKFYDFRLPIQDIYEIGKRKIYVGNILSGEVKVGDKVMCYPDKKKVEIKEIFEFNKRVKRAKSPKAIGIVANKKLKRGDILANGVRPIVTRKFSPLVFCLTGSIKSGNVYTVKCVTQEVKCKVKNILEKIDIETLKRRKGISKLNKFEIGKIEISLEKPMVVEKFNKLKELGRFVILDKGEIIAGGIIV